MTVNLGQLDPSIIQYCIDDVDNCLFSYPAGYAGDFSYYTAEAAVIIAQRRFESGDQSLRLLKVSATPQNKLCEIARQSYADHGLTTEEFALRFGLSRRELYIAHHYLIVKERVQTEFPLMFKPRLQHGLELLRAAEVHCNTFTNGTQFYAEEVTRALRLKHLYNAHSGADSENDGLITLKGQRKAWIDMLTRTGIPAKTGYIYHPAGKMR